MRGHSTDTLLAQLLAEVEDHDLAARRLLAAERQMDEAAVFTIHGFCQRMLRQNAFESGALFETEFLTDDSRLRLQAVSDYWRAEFYPVDQPLARAVRRLWSSPAALLREMGAGSTTTSWRSARWRGTRPWRRGTASPWPASGR
jgi:exodeoxyribonuclease V beta subunit